MRALQQFTERFGQLMSRTLLTVLYYGVLGPVALVYQRVADPLHLRRRPEGNWTAWRGTDDSLRAARRQD